MQVSGNVCRALPVYLPVYLFPALLVHRKRLLDPKRAPDIARRAALGAMRSSLFLSLYCTLAWRGACVGFQHSSESNLLCMLCLLCLTQPHCSIQANLPCNNLGIGSQRQNVMYFGLHTKVPFKMRWAKCLLLDCALGMTCRYVMMHVVCHPAGS